MSRDSNGNYSLPAGINPVVTGTPIDAAWANPTLSDLATEVTNSLDRNGRGGMLVPFKLLDGTVAAPGITFQSEPTSGFYRAGTGDVRLSITGTMVMKWTQALITLAVPVVFSDDVTADVITANSFVGPLTGLASLNLPLAGGTVTGPVTVEDMVTANNGITFPDGTVQTTSAVPVTEPPMMPWSTVAVNTATSKSRGYAVRTNGSSLTMTLPAAPAEGDTIAFKDADGTASVAPFTIARNGKTIEGLAEDMTVDINYVKFGLAYLNGSWRIV